MKHLPRRLFESLPDPDRETDEFRVFVGMVSEIQDHPEHEAAYTADIREEAKLALARHPSA